VVKKDFLIIAAIKAMRPVHWVKNFSLYAAVLLSGLLFDKGYFASVSWGFISFCLISSAAYLINDILDAKGDREHPIKKNRPVASGSLSPYLAFFEAVFLSLVSLYIASSLNYFFFITVLVYLVLQILYSLILKNIPTFDILVIATGFIIRVYAGAFLIDAHLSVWFLLCVVSTALFLASGKRRAELNVLETVGGVTRKSLVRYKKELLNSYVTMFGNAAWMSWVLYTFFESPRAALPFWLTLAELSKTTTVGKLLMITTPVVIFGIMRYESLIFEGKSETPEKLFLTDKYLITAVFLWVTIVYWVLYSGVSVSGV